MSFLFEIIPVFLFFLTFKFYDIYAATLVGILATFVQVIFTRLWFRKWDKKQLITLAAFLLFGGLTLYFHNPIFVKWKPTIVFWLFALVLLGSQLFTAKPLIERLMENMLQPQPHKVPKRVWHTLNFLWIIFFFVIGAVNLYIAYFYSNDAWVNFKFYGVTSALLIVSVLQALYISRYLPESKKND